jgi:lantibiotic biosynthesis protein
MEGSPKGSAKRVELRKVFESSGFFVLRSALLPFAELTEWNRPIEQPQLDWVHARAERVLRLRQAFERKELREALFFASPELERCLDAWLSGSRSDPKLERTLSRYFQRMAGRQTPFGLCAGISFGQVAERDRFELDGRDGYHRHVRPGMGYLVQLLSALARRDSVHDKIRYEPNVTLHRVFGRFRFAAVEFTGELDEPKAYPVVDVEPTPHLEAALERAAGGATPAEISAALEPLVGCGAEVEEFVRGLVENQILVPVWLPRVSGAEPFAAAVATLAEHPELSSEAERLGSVCRSLAELDGAVLGQNTERYRSLAEQLPALPTPAEPAHLFQTDLIKPATELTLSGALVQKLLRAAELIQRTSLAPADPRLADFCARFSERYGSRYVPLLEALDADLGVGFEAFHSQGEAALLEGLSLGSAQAALYPFTALEELRQRILSQALLGGGFSYEIDPETLDLFPKRSAGEPPESFAVAAMLAQRVGEPLRVIAPFVISPSGVVTLARFCHADRELAQAVKAHLELEQARAGDCLLADVAYLPQRAANLVLRPVLRSYEIAYGGKSGAAPDRQIPVTDLCVGIELGRVTLRSQSRQKRVAVRITNAHNSQGPWNLPLYRFLGALQGSGQGQLASSWSWGTLEHSPFLPRIGHEDIVLSRARWTLWESDFKALVGAEARSAFADVQTLRARLGLPRWLTLVEGDQRLVVDLDNVLSVEVLVHELRGKLRVVLEELLPSPDELVARGPEGAFVSEVVVPFVRREAALRTSDPPSVARPWGVENGAGRDRSYGPGSEWLYAKIYASSSQHAEILAEIKRTVLEPLIGEAVSQWFFVPYADPEPHLRIRFRGEPRALLETVLPELKRSLDPWLKSGRAWRFQLDTYEREVERYGGPLGIELAEQLFGADSDAVSSLLPLCADDEDLRWQLTLVGIDRLLRDLGLSLTERAALTRTVADDYGTEFGVTSDAWKKIGAKYRPHAAWLGELLWRPEAHCEGPLALGFAALRERSERLQPVCAALERLQGGGNLHTERNDLARSFIHMHAVRMLGQEVRSYELLIYDFLRRLYAAQSARKAPGP